MVIVDDVGSSKKSCKIASMCVWESGGAILCL